MGREFSVEDGFQITMLFLTDFWWNFIKNEMVKKELINQEQMTPEERESASIKDKDKDDLHADNNFFFLFVCDGTSDKVFEKTVEKRMHIPPIEQHNGLIVKEGQLFLLAIDFCKQFNEQNYRDNGKNSLMFAIDWLKDMRNHPQKHKTEWNIWNKTIIDVIDNGQKSLGFF